MTNVERLAKLCCVYQSYAPDQPSADQFTHWVTETVRDQGIPRTLEILAGMLANSLRTQDEWLWSPVKIPAFLRRQAD